MDYLFFTNSKGTWLECKHVDNWTEVYKEHCSHCKNPRCRYKLIPEDLDELQNNKHIWGVTHLQSDDKDRKSLARHIIYIGFTTWEVQPITNLKEFAKVYYE